MEQAAQKQQRRLYHLDDIEVGLRFSGGSHIVDEKQITDFATQFDPQLFHVDPTAAKETIFGGLIASGWHTASMTMRLLLEACPVAGGIIGLGGDVSWPQATRPQDTLTVEGEVTEVRPSRSQPDRGIVTVRVETKNQRSEIVQILTAKLLVFRKAH